MARSDLSVAKNSEIHDRLSRVEKIIEHLDADDFDLDEGKTLQEEGQQLLVEVREILERTRLMQLLSVTPHNQERSDEPADDSCFPITARHASALCLLCHS